MKTEDLDVMSDNLNTLPFSSHTTNVYKDKVAYLLKETELHTLNINGYVTGTMCQKDIECLSYYMNGSGYGCINNICIDNNSYDNNDQIACDDWQDCESGRCDFTWSGKLRCQPKKIKGNACNEDSDCISGTCSWLFLCS
jgi:hypothetical protein